MSSRLTVLVSLLVVAAAASCSRGTPQPTPVERGKYLVNVGGCNHEARESCGFAASSRDGCALRP